MTLPHPERSRGTQFGRSTYAVVLLLLASCAKCGSAAPVDAGPVWYQPLSTATRERHSTDLRSVFMLLLPEYRGAHIKGGHAALIRSLEPHTPLGPLLAKTLKSNGFSEEGTRGDLKLSLTAEGPPAVLALSLPVNAQLIENIYNSPNSMSTMEMALFFPRDVKDFTTIDEKFELELNYEATDAARAQFLVHQVVFLLLQNGQWKADALPEGFADGGMQNADITLHGLDDGAVLHFVRVAEKVTATYFLVTDRAKAP